jgi:hypothetical protein
MARSRFCLALAAALALAPAARAGILIEGTLSGPQEVPPNFITPATGTFVGELDLSGSAATLTFTVTYSDLIGGNVVGANFHDAPPGFNGPDVRDYNPGAFTSPDGSFSGTWTSSDAQPLTPALVSDLLAGDIYFNIETQELPTGEIRGQLVPEPAALGLALLGAAGLVLAGFRRRRRR